METELVFVEDVLMHPGAYNKDIETKAVLIILFIR
tara:strand:- start:21230 stop:21334 length:105 start_codon:yes stop_codon:yes gene_type:complete